MASKVKKSSKETKDVLFALRTMLVLSRESDAELKQLKETKKDLLATKELCAKGIVRLCKDIKKGIVRKNPDTKKEKTRKHKFSNAMITIANIQLRKYK